MKKVISLLCIMTLTIFGVIGCNSNPKTLTGEEIFEKLSLSTVEVYAENEYISSLGTGFYIDKAGTVVTNYHVIKDCSSAYVTTNDGGTYKVTSIAGYSIDLDIAILTTTKKNSEPVTICSSVATGEVIYVLGSSLGLTSTFSEGLVSSAKREIGNISYIQISAPISRGNSGGPVINAYGQVVGIASAGLEEGQNLNLALPISVIDQVSLDTPITMEEFYETTSTYAHLEDRIVALGTTLALRTITLSDSFTAEYILAMWESGEATEATMIEIMDEYGANQGGGQLYIIDPGTYVEEVEDWCFDPNRRPGDYAIIETFYGCTICYISHLNINK